MAVKNWLARALARAMVFTITVTAYDVTTTYSVTINGKSVSVLGSGGTTTTVATALTTALNASTIPEFAEITWTSNAAVITGTVDTAGNPVTVTTSESGGAGTIGDPSTTTAATGPNHWDDANNWDTGAVPVTGDEANVNLDLGSVLYGVAQSGVTLTNLRIYSATFTTNTFGLPKISTSGNYTEYRDRPAVGATLCKIDCGASLVDLNFGSVQNDTEVRRSGQAFGVMAVLLRGTNGANVIDAQAGHVGLAFYDGESYNAATATFATAAQVVAGTGSVLADTVSNGNTIMQGTGTNWQTAGGVSDIRGTPGFSILDCDGGTTIAKFGGTISDVVVGGSSGTLDASQDNTDRVFTNCTLDRGGTILDPNETITFTNGIDREPGVSSLVAT